MGACVPQGMEVFSTVLWHLKEELALSHLAQQVIAQDRHSPHAWAVLGNCFSLQKVRRGERCLVRLPSQMQAACS